MKKMCLHIIIILMFAFCLASCNKKDSVVSSKDNLSDVIFTIKIDGGWSEPEHVVLHQDGVLQVYAGYNDIESCLDSISDTHIFSRKLSDQELEKIVEQWNNLPECCSEPVVIYDGTFATFQKDGKEYFFYLASKANTELSSFVKNIMEIYR